jgi:flagellar hook assembly protein FlgD
VSDEAGRRSLFVTEAVSLPALPLTLYQNYPNPFNPSTTISYYLPEDSPVALTVYDVSGRRVADLIGKAEKKGRHSVTWDGRNETGGSAASGIYFSRLTVGKETISKKMVMLR